MSKQDQSISDAPNENNSVISSEKNNDMVAYDTYRKTVDKEKNLRERTRSLESELDSYKQKELESQGRFEDVISGLKEKVTHLEKENKDTRGNFVVSTVDGAIERELVKRGCIDTRDALSLLNDDDYSSLEVDERFNVNGANVKNLVDRFEQKRQYMFKQNSIQISDSAPTSKVSLPRKIDFSKMTTKEIIAHGVKLEAQNKLK